MEWALYLLIMYEHGQSNSSKNSVGIERLATYQTSGECENIAINLANAAIHTSKSFHGPSINTIEHQYTCAPVPEAYIYE